MPPIGIADPFQHKEGRDASVKAVGGFLQTVLTVAEPVVRTIEDVGEINIMSDPLETSISIENAIRKTASLPEIKHDAPLSEEKKIIAAVAKPMANVVDKVIDFFGL